MSKYNVLIVGAGKQGANADDPGSKKIISYAHAFKEHPGFNKLTFYDTHTYKASDASIKWNCTFSNDLNWHLKYCNPDIVVISIPDEAHYKVLMQVSEYPPKLVICEKPLCTNLEQAREIVELYRENNIPLMVNYTRRFLPYYQELKRRYEAREFGELIGALGTFNRDMFHSGTHMVDFFGWIFGYENIGKTWGINYLKNDIYRIWQMDIFFEKYHWREERIGNMPVWDYYDKSHWYIAENAFNFLEGREQLKCTGEQALRTLEICFEMMENNR